MTYKIIEKIIYEDGSSEEYIREEKEYTLYRARDIVTLLNTVKGWYAHDLLMNIKREYSYKSTEECKNIPTDPSIKYKMLWNKMIKEKEKIC